MLLKSCPFCGSKNIEIHFPAMENYCCCDDCGTQGPILRMASYSNDRNYMKKLKYKIMMKWNKRW